MQWDVNLGDPDPRRAGPLARRAEDLGAEGVWVGEITHSPFTLLAGIADATTDVDLGSSIALAFPRSPMVTAYTAWDLQELSGGRFVLGLGTQVKGHIERRFGVEWDSPGPRLRDYLRCLRAIWNAWSGGEDVDYQGEFYSITLCPPFFTPAPIDDPEVPLYIAAVNEYNLRTAGMLCDGLHVHPFHSPKYLREFILPHLREGAETAGRSPDDVELVTSVFAAVGDSASERAAVREELRFQIAFYGSTRTYRKVFETHGWGDVCPKLHRLSVDNRWDDMAELITDEMMDTFVVEGTWETIGDEIRTRYDHMDRVSFYREFRDEPDWNRLFSAGSS